MREIKLYFKDFKGKHPHKFVLGDIDWQCIVFIYNVLCAFSHGTFCFYNSSGSSFFFLYKFSLKLHDILEKRCWIFNQNICNNLFPIFESQYTNFFFVISELCSWIICKFSWLSKRFHVDLEANKKTNSQSKISVIVRRPVHLCKSRIKFTLTRTWRYLDTFMLISHHVRDEILTAMCRDIFI